MCGKLVVLAGPLCGESFHIDVHGLSIGRDSTAQLSIPDRLMSRRHCEVQTLDGSFVLHDLGSSNGTFVNGIPVRERSLNHGDRIRVGDSVLLFLDRQGPAQAGSTGEALTEGAVDDRTTRVPRPVPAREPQPESETPAAIMAEVLAGRVTLQAHDMVGESAPMRAVYERIRKVAPSDCTVLVLGETGTGKELAARAIHQNSPRARHPFVAVNCAALTETLLESELFGHEKGAFTGAVALKKGRLEVADGGTVFLDEIGELAPALQAKFLRALQYHEFERVGGTRVIKVNVRVVAATNQNLEANVAAGRFRQDLWYRLNVVTLTMPPLRERRADVPLLAGHFAARYSKGRPVDFSREAMEALCAYQWPGNVRELENAIERALVLGNSGRIVADDLPETIVDASPSLPGGAVAAFHQTVLETKRRLILGAIDRAGGNYTAAARLLGINPTYLHRLLRNLQLKGLAARR
jgi:transcriptional regulator with GAF, ATPase, and Fis domain